MNRLSRSTALKIAATLSFLLGVAGFIFALPFLTQGAAEIGLSPDAPPYLIIVSAFVFSILRVVGAYGAWKSQRWGIVLTLIANALDAVSAVPGILLAPSVELWVTAIVTVVLGVIIIVLCLWRDPKPALA